MKCSLSHSYSLEEIAVSFSHQQFFILVDFFMGLSVRKHHVIFEINKIITISNEITKYHIEICLYTINCIINHMLYDMLLQLLLIPNKSKYMFSNHHNILLNNSHS